MGTQTEAIEIAVGQEEVAGTVLAPDTNLPGVLFIHGWGGSQEKDLARARGLAALGCVCLTFDLRGHARTEAQHYTVTRNDNLQDAMAAYDRLASRPAVDRSAIAVVGSSYGGYLAALLTTERPVRWLALRAPALYRDGGWQTPKRKLDREDLARYRQTQISSAENSALGSCANFTGDVLIVESEYDDFVPRPTILSYKAAFSNPRSLTYRLIKGADHALTDEPCNQAYTSILTNWATEMVLGART